MTVGEESTGAAQADPAGADGFSAPTYSESGSISQSGSTAPHRRLRGPRVSVRPVSTGNVTVTRAVLARGSYFSRLLAYKVRSASEADGARESGLTALIWNQVMSYAADAMVTVALAGTVFFSAPSEAQRGNVLLYLLMT
ncbi:MAG: hypothetical protein JO144_16845, partial [Actinobacteria bacterium]|nr:hypothetical protein [Actinomycetota bacterium]